MLSVSPDWEQKCWEFWAYPSFSLAQVMEIQYCGNKSSTSTSGTFQGCDLKSGCRSEAWPLSTDLIGLQMSQYQPWQHSEFGGLSLLQTQFPGCLFFHHPKWQIVEALFSQSLWDGLIGLLPVLLWRQMSAGYLLLCNSETIPPPIPGLTRLFGVCVSSVPLCLLECV